MKTEIKVVILLFISITILSALLPGILFPTDNLYYLPSFSIENWSRPHNSLLSDPLYQFEPWRYYARQLFLQGNFPLWNNLNGAGVPLFANPIATIAYPLQLFYYVFPIKFSSWFLPLIKIFLYGVFSYFYLRIIGVSKSVGTVGSVLIATSPYFIMWLLWPQTSVLLFFPLILLLTEVILKLKEHSLVPYIILGIVYAFVFLGGHPGTIVHLVFVHTIYCVLRSLKAKIKIVKILSCIGLGFLLSAFQMLPWLEFMTQSTAYRERFLIDHVTIIPLKIILMSFFPFVLGAPHHEIYKQLSPIYNFQEIAGGYVGPIILVSMIGVFFVKKSAYIKSWLIIALISFLFAYSIWPFSILHGIPPFNGVANLRLVAFGAFGLLILFSLILEEVRNSNLVLPKSMLQKLGMFVAVTLFLLYAFEDIVTRALLQKLPEKLDILYLYLRNNSLLLLFSTFLYVGLLLYFFTQKNKRKRRKLMLFFMFPVLLQGTFLFWNYYPINSVHTYYPATLLTKKLSVMPQKPILEVGNPTLPPNINLVYGVKLAEDDYALNLYSYKLAFDRSFPDKNHWGKVDSIDLESLQKFGIGYILSDYDVNNKKIVAQGKFENLIPLTNSLETPFIARSNNLSQVRLLTANFNRNNNCSAIVTLRDDKDVVLASNTIDCQMVRDKMFVTVDLFANINIGSIYKIKIETTDSYKGNRIAFWGNNNRPFLEILYKTPQKLYPQVSKIGGIYIFSVPKSNYIDFDGTYKMISNENEKTVLHLFGDKEQTLQIRRVNYPGWEANLNGREIPPDQNKLFLSVNVPKGEYILEFIYKPKLLFVGITISGLTLAGIIFYLMHLKSSSLRKSLATLLKYFKSKPLGWHYHVLYVLSGVVIGLVSLFLMLKFLPITFSVKSTTAINWFTHHNYPRQQDYFYLIFGFLYVFFTSIFTWLLLYVIKRKI